MKKNHRKYRLGRWGEADYFHILLHCHFQQLVFGKLWSFFLIIFFLTTPTNDACHCHTVRCLHFRKPNGHAYQVVPCMAVSSSNCVLPFVSLNCSTARGLKFTADETKSKPKSPHYRGQRTGWCQQFFGAIYLSPLGYAGKEIKMSSWTSGLR